ncbi:hypothetical protein R1sor_018520 [Riccia sorocarpa]|uniref:Uncharacterized protein n=1 Tax=Riccia sorocarpa TaxID=122646 RepID=A0ABD3I9X8_9MARC
MTRPPRPKYPSDSKTTMTFAVEPAIAAVLHSREDRVVVDLEEILNVTPGIQRDPDQIIDEETFEDDGSECSDVDMVQDATAEIVADSEDDEVSCCMDSQHHQPVDPASRVYPDATYGFWSKSKSGKRRKPGWISATLELWEENKNRLHADLLRRGRVHCLALFMLYFFTQEFTV